MPTKVMPRTVSELSPDELEFYRKALRNYKRVKSIAPARLTQARKVARKAASILRKQFGVEKVILFGSVVNSPLFHSRSDVDIAVWGLDEKMYFRVVGILQGISSEIGVDLVLFETASPAMQEVILRDGKPL
jgi:uncharacterized protein